VHAAGAGSGAAGAAGSPSPGAGNVTGTYGGITGNANICADSGAFTGPDIPADFAP